MNITFIGNCQTVTLCFYFQQLLSDNENICWISYGDEFIKRVNKWSNKCKNKILNYDIAIQKIKESDVIIYQNINKNKSLYSNTDTLRELAKSSCKLIQIPSVYLVYDDFDNSIQEMITRENNNNVDIKVSDIFIKYKNKNLMLSFVHPNTFLFMEIMKALCEMLDLDFFTEKQYSQFVKNPNYMELP